MTIPQVESDGHLPGGLHRATLDEVRDQFVDRAPSPWHRETTYRALEIELGLLVDLVGRVPVWLGGDFVSHLDVERPLAVAVAICRDEVHLGMALQAPSALERLSLRNVTFFYPFRNSTPMLRPMGGLIDAFLAPANYLQGWRNVLSLKHGGDDVPRGFVEVLL